MLFAGDQVSQLPGPWGHVWRTGTWQEGHMHPGCLTRVSVRGHRPPFPHCQPHSWANTGTCGYSGLTAEAMSP